MELPQNFAKDNENCWTVTKITIKVPNKSLSRIAVLGFHNHQSQLSPRDLLSKMY